MITVYINNSSKNTMDKILFIPNDKKSYCSTLKARNKCPVKLLADLLPGLVLSMELVARLQETERP